MNSQAQTVYVAMSGGVDSSVAAALLKKRGFTVVGVFMKPWTGNCGNTERSENAELSCMWKWDREDALRAAAVLELPLLTWDFSKEYKKEVGDYMIREYRAGRTPNPDVMCNKEIKFGLFLKKALKKGADYIATGHYIRLRKPQITNTKSQTNLKPKTSNSNTKYKIQNTRYKLLQAKDKNKDQSYFLWTLTQEQLKYCLFPIGDYTKPEVRKMAKKFGLPNHNKKDSQGVCFIGPLDMKDFLKKYIKPKSGKIQLLEKRDPSTRSIPQGSEPVESTGSGRSNYKIIGLHDGVYYYTIGQRHGLDIKNGQGPYYVTGKDIKKNIIYVGKEKNLYSHEAKVIDISWISGLETELPSTWKLGFQADVKVRYRSKSEKATLFRSSTPKHLVLKFKNPVRAITPGQSTVFYNNQELLGGGIIR